MRIYIIISIVCFLILPPAPAHAACTNPAGVEGKQIYNTTHKTMQFCDGTKWYAMKGGSNSTATTMISGWPDAISCGTGTNEEILYYSQNNGTTTTYGPPAVYSSSKAMYFNSSTGAYQSASSLNHITQCVGKSITTLYAEGRAFNFVGGGSGGGTPSGAVMAFDLTACPNGWSEYTPAYGRFIRGIDKSGTSIDPDGTRTAGNTQEDEFKSHNHEMRYRNGVIGTSGDGLGVFNKDTNNNNFSDGIQTGYSLPPMDNTGGAETRPKNVALLYCRKD